MSNWFPCRFLLVWGRETGAGTLTLNGLRLCVKSKSQMQESGQCLSQMVQEAGTLT